MHMPNVDMVYLCVKLSLLTNIFTFRKKKQQQQEGEQVN